MAPPAHTAASVAMINERDALRVRHPKPMQSAENADVRLRARRPPAVTGAKSPFIAAAGVLTPDK
jgi:hypothetical protein